MADSDSSIAWHRAQIKRLREALLDVEAGTVIKRKTARSKKTGQASLSMADLKRKIRQSEQIVDAHDRLHVRRPRGTDSQSLAGVRST
jgi:hypothetical protein